MAVIYVLIFFAFSSGIFNGIIEGKNYNQPIFLPTRSVQNLYETTIGISILVFGFIGVLLLYKVGSMQKLNEKFALSSAGFIIVTVSIVFLYKLMEFKS